MFEQSALRKNAANTDDIFNLLILRKNYARSIEYMFDGADTYGGTGLRCLLQFFFCLRLPNAYDHPNIDDNQDAAAAGWIGATLAITLIVWSGWQYKEDQIKLWIRRELSDEFLLTFYAKGYGDQTEDKSIADETLKANVLAIRQMILELEKDEKRKNEISFIKEKATENAETIKKILKDAKPSTANNTPNWIAQWNTGFDFLLHYGYTQWLFWMCATLIVCQVKDNYTKDNKELSGEFTEEVLGLGGAGVYVQLLIGVVVATAIYFYARSKKKEETALCDENQLKGQQDALRGWWMNEKNNEKNAVSKIVTATTPSHAKEFDDALRYSRSLSFFTTLVGTFLAANIAAWPISVFYVSECMEEKPADEDVILTIFVITLSYALVHSLIRNHHIGLQNQAGRDLAIEGFDATETVNKIQINSRSTFKAFWWDDKEHFHKMIYYVIGEIIGNSGFLLTRTLFSGGIGNVNSGKPMEHGSPTDTLFLMGAGIALVMIAVNMYTYYRNTIRNEVLSAARDYQLAQKDTERRNSQTLTL